MPVVTPPAPWVFADGVFFHLRHRQVFQGGGDAAQIPLDFGHRVFHECPSGAGVPELGHQSSFLAD